jgi:iron complex transport system substrate-binding protein
MFSMKRFVVAILLSLSFVVFSCLMCPLWGTSSLTLTDKLGRTVTIDIPVKRAVVVITYELVPALGIWDQIVGVSRWAEEECDLYRTFVKTKPELKIPRQLNSLKKRA